MNIRRSLSEPWDSPADQQLVRTTTTLSLTHSNGYINFKGQANDVLYWPPFWNADLGRPIGEKGQLYEAIDGLFIREFTGGWAVYNRSGKAQTISLPQETTAVSRQTTASTEHTIPDLDGEIFLRQVTEDVNGDGIVNILDLVMVANAFGEATPDLNGDGVVNVLDLVFVSNKIGNRK